MFGCFYLGALVIALPAWWLLGKPQYPASSPCNGASSSGWGRGHPLGCFLWNKGRPLVSSGVLAIMNNALIPAGLLVNLVLWERIPTCSGSSGHPADAGFPSGSASVSRSVSAD